MGRGVVGWPGYRDHPPFCLPNEREEALAPKLGAIAPLCLPSGNFFALPLSPAANLRHNARMTEQSTLQIKLRLKGGSGPNANWHWEIHDAAGKVVKTGSAVGPEHKAFATARIAKEKLEQSSGR